MAHVRPGGDEAIRAAFSRSSIGLGVVGSDHRWTEVNPSLCRMLDRAEDALVGSVASAVLHPDDRATFDEVVGALLRGEAVTADLELRVDGPIGSPTWLAVSAVKVDEGRTASVYCQIRNISARQQAEERLAREAEQAQVLADLSAEVAAAGPDPDVIVDAVTRRLADEVGGSSYIHLLPEGERPAQVRVHDEDPRRAAELEKALLAAPAGADVAGADGIAVPMTSGARVLGYLGVRTAAGGPLRPDDAALVAEVAVRTALAVDNARLLLDARRELDERRRVEQELRLLVEGVRDHAVFLLDLEGRIVSWNAGAARVLARSHEDVLGQRWSTLFPGRPEAVVAAERLLAGAQANGRAGEDVPLLRGDGREVAAEVEVAELVGVGDQRGFSVVVRDVTDRRELEAQLAQSQKMEAVGRLAGCIAHDFNNLLTAILGYTEMGLEEVPPGERLHRDLEQVHAAGSRAADLVHQLLAFSRRNVRQAVTVDLNRIVGGLEPILTRLLGPHLDLRIEQDPTCGAVRTGDRSQLEQVVLNLAINARDAMPGGGRLTIATRGDAVLGDPGDPEGQEAGPFVLLMVSDTGSGMEPDVLSRCFEPFFTTKEPGEGTGLGLSTVYGIVNQSGGQIRVRSAPGAGTTFLVYLPMASGPAAEAGGPEADAGARGSETVLLVEDEAPLRELAARTLERQGYEVLTAGDGAEAVELADGHDGPIHLLVTDVVMPHLSGPDVASRLAERRPDLVVLYVSGYAPDGVLAARAPGRGADFLQKPFTARQLASTTRRLLDHLAP